MSRVTCLMRDQRGFTYVELAAVLLILSVLVMIVLGTYQASTALAEKVSCQSSLRSTRQALSMYRQAHATWPGPLSELSPDYISSHGLRCPGTKQTYTYDADTGGVSCALHAP